TPPTNRDPEGRGQCLYWLPTCTTSRPAGAATLPPVAFHPRASKRHLQTPATWRPHFRSRLDLLQQLPEVGPVAQGFREGGRALGRVDLIRAGTVPTPQLHGTLEHGDGQILVLADVAVVGAGQLAVDAGYVVQDEIVAAAVEQRQVGFQVRLVARL